MAYLYIIFSTGISSFGRTPGSWSLRTPVRCLRTALRALASIEKPRIFYLRTTPGRCPSEAPRVFFLCDHLEGLSYICLVNAWKISFANTHTVETLPQYIPARYPDPGISENKNSKRIRVRKLYDVQGILIFYILTYKVLIASKVHN